jgi:hypothetical protein
MHLRRSLNLHCTVKSIHTHSPMYIISGQWLHIFSQSLYCFHSLLFPFPHLLLLWLLKKVNPLKMLLPKARGRDGLSTATTDSSPSCKLQDTMWSPVGSITVLFTVEIACLIASQKRCYPMYVTD